MSDWRVPAELPDLRRVGILGLDTETKDDRLRADMGSGWPFRAGHLCGVSVAYRAGSEVHGLYFPIRHPDTQNFDPEQIYQWLRDHVAANVRFVTQNGLYDWGWLRAEAGIHMPPGERIEEIGALATMVDENRYRYSLDALCAWRGLPGKDETLLHEGIAAFGLVTSKRKKLRPASYIWQLPARYVGPYAEADAINTLRLYEDLDPILDREGTRAAYRLECDLLPMVLEMRLRGIRVDLAAAEQARDLLLQKRDAVFTDLSDKLGCQVGMHEIGRTTWLAETFDKLGIAYPRTEKGNPSFTGGQLGWMSKHPHLMPQLITKADKYNNAAVNVLERYILGHAVNGRIHAEIHPHRGEANGAKSSRFSYSDPPLQLMPSRDPEHAPLIRGVFLPEDGEIWAKPDASQQEFRLVVHFANQHRLPKAAEAVARYRDDPNADFHALAAALTGLDRTDAKQVNFAKIYGAGVAKFAAMIGKPLEEAQRLYAQYDRELPFLRMLSETYTKRARDRGYITLYDGARRHFDRFAPAGKWSKGAGPCSIEEARERIKDPDHPWYRRGQLYRADTHTALNALIQGSAARHTKLWMRACWRAGIVPLLQMHDCLDCSVSSREQAELVARLGEEAVRLDVPMRVDLKYGRTWGDAAHTWEKLHGEAPQTMTTIKTPDFGIRSGSNAELAAADTDNPAPAQHETAPETANAKLPWTTPQLIEFPFVEYQRGVLKTAGFSPIPLIGKIPTIKEWQTKLDVSLEEMRTWSGIPNTGLLTRKTPTLDIDILTESAALAVEDLAKERFGARGAVLVRVGKAPKRAIPFRTTAPFDKLSVPLIAPNGSKGEKLEFLASGQQFAAFGAHPDTGQPYRWSGGEPGEVRHDQLPLITQAEAQAFVDAAVRLLVTRHGYTHSKPKPESFSDDGFAHSSRVDWSSKIADILTNGELHDSIRDLAASLIGCKISPEAAKGILRAVMLNSSAPQDARWQERFDDIDRAVNSAAAKFQPTAPAASYDLVRASDIVPRPMDWLWQGHLLRGFQELLTGVPGGGKSQIHCALVAYATTGGVWPDGCNGIPAGNVIMLTAEDCLDQTIVPRLIAAGADRERVYVLKKIRKDKKERMFLLSEDIDLLEQMIVKIGDVRLVTIDPITAYMGGKIDSHRATDVRGQLGPLADLAERTDIALSAITHPPKHSSQRAIDHFIGSQAFIAAARIGHMAIEEIGEDADGNRAPTGRSLFTNPKNNVSRKMATLAYRVDEKQLAGGIKAPFIVWEEIVDITADQAVAAATPTKKDHGGNAVVFLLNVLANGPVPMTIVEERAAACGFSRDQLKRAKLKMGILTFKEEGKPHGQWLWALP